MSAYVPNISSVYSGAADGYIIELDGKHAYFTTDKRDCALFKAQLMIYYRVCQNQFESANARLSYTREQITQ